MLSMKLTPAQAGFAKGLILAAVLAVVSFVGDVANLEGVLNPAIATLVAAVASSLESHLKAKSGGTSALFGAVKVQ